MSNGATGKDDVERKKAWLNNQIEIYHAERRIYKLYAETLKQILQRVCEIYAPLAIVMAREKTLPSFAEKAVRKSDKYDDPVHQFTDLCGARVITETQKELRQICAFIERNFEIDVQNSLDALNRLRISEFGYRSIHYIVQFKSLEMLGVKIPDEIGTRKAEIQVRTLLEHAWAAIYHDRLYKTELKVPPYWDRKMSRVSAMLEVGEQEFSSVVEGLDAYKLNYGAYMTKEDLNGRIETQKVIFEKEESRHGKRNAALNISRLSKTNWNWGNINDYLKHFIDDECNERPEILAEHGNAVCQLFKTNPESDEYKKGQDEIKNAADTGDLKIKISALSYLGWTYRNEGNDEEALVSYKKAYELDPSNPYNLISYVEHEIFYGAKPDFLTMIKNAFEGAINTCRRHVEVGIEIPWAILTIGKFNMFIEKWYESLSSYLKAIQYCISKDACVPDEIFENEMAFLKCINRGKELTTERKWIRKLLLLARLAKFDRDNDRNELKKYSLRKKKFQLPVVIIAGGTDRNMDNRIDYYRDYIIECFRDFTGTIISGGTTSGISGLVGEVSERLNAKDNDSLDVIGYIPKNIPVDLQVDNRYKEKIVTGSEYFDPEQPIQVWIDLISNGVEPSDVTLLCVEGGELSSFECKLAATLGAVVGIVRTGSNAVENLLSDPDWRDEKKIHLLPEDKMTIKAFVCGGISDMDENLLLKVARAIHDEYLRDRRYKTTDPSSLPWELLPDDLKKSNIEQAAHAAKILDKLGYGVRPCIKPEIISFTDEEIEIMSEMEHGRWVAERLKSGWIYDEERDHKNKKSPYIVGWTDLTEEIKDYDRKTVKNWPRFFATIDIEIFKL